MSYEHVTFLLCLPRSRSAWLAELVRQHCAASWHCPLQQCASIDELKMKIDAVPPPGRIFIADVAALYFVGELLVKFPGAKFLIVHRKAAEVELSMKRLKCAAPPGLRDAESHLLSIASSLRVRPDVMAGSFFELNSPALVRAIFKFITGNELTDNRLYIMQKRNVQVSVAEQFKRTDIAKQRVLFGSARIIH